MSKAFQSTTNVLQLSPSLKFSKRKSHRRLEGVSIKKRAESKSPLVRGQVYESLFQCQRPKPNFLKLSSFRSSRLLKHCGDRTWTTPSLAIIDHSRGREFLRSAAQCQGGKPEFFWLRGHHARIGEKLNGLWLLSQRRPRCSACVSRVDRPMQFPIFISPEHQYSDTT